jgi:DnaJ domain
MTVTYRCQYVRCCNPRCKSCPHGPYWYGFWKEGGRTKSRYYGKVDPRPGQPDSRVEASGLAHWRLIFDRRTASCSVATDILGLHERYTQDDAKRAYRSRCFKWHPDREGSHELMQLANAAWSYLRGFHGWK